MTRVGVLGLQGDVREHFAVLDALGAAPLVVKTPSELRQAEALVIPGGESTTIGKLTARFGLLDPLRQAIEDGLPAYGTCAGMILLASAVSDGDQPLIGVLDVVVRRNAFGRQNESFETELSIKGVAEPFRAVFVRAPWIEKTGADVDVLASVDDHPVMVRQGKIIATSFHPELTGDGRIHQMLIESV